MQRVKRSLLWLRDGAGADTTERTQRWLGLEGLLVGIVVLAASAIIYLVPMGTTMYTAVLPDAGSVKEGEDIRVAGITVGTVHELTLTEDSVHMTFTVESDVALGDTTSLEIRMLTPIGGHYVMLFPSGTEQLGSSVIPADRVRLPYNLMEAIQDAQRPTAGVDGDTLRRSLSDLTASLERSPGSIATFTDAMSTLVGLLDKQNQDVSRALAVADEYVSMLGQSRSVIGAMLTKIGVMETQLLDRRADVNEALRVASELFSRLAAIEPAWREQLEPALDQILAAGPQLEDLVEQLGAAADQLARAGDGLRAVLTPNGVEVDHSGQSVSVAKICVPVPGKGC